VGGRGLEAQTRAEYSVVDEKEKNNREEVAGRMVSHSDHDHSQNRAAFVLEPSSPKIDGLFTLAG
jgi:hypothetical protein